MPIRLNGSTSGYVDLAAQAVGGDVEHKLPAAPAGEILVIGNNGGLVLGTAQNSTSGTAIDFTGIPSWAKRITLSFNGVSCTSGGVLLVQVGAGSIQTTGYKSFTGGAGAAGGATAVAGLTSAAGFLFEAGGPAAAWVRYGQMILTSMGSNLWSCGFSLGLDNGAGSYFGIAGGGSVTLSGALNRLRLTTTGGTDTFDAGTVNIMYE
jgi:hypothetical protein